MSLAPMLGRLGHVRNKSLLYVEAVRGWVMPVAASAAAAKYLGLPSRWAILAALLVPVAVELAGVLFGRWLYNAGGVEADFEMSLKADPYKRGHLRVATETLEEMRRARQSLAHLVVQCDALRRRLAAGATPPE